MQHKQCGFKFIFVYRKVEFAVKSSHTYTIWWWMVFREIMHLNFEHMFHPSIQMQPNTLKLQFFFIYFNIWEIIYTPVNSTAQYIDECNVECVMETKISRRNNINITITIQIRVDELDLNADNTFSYYLFVFVQFSRVNS